jgi:hypothetical protein
MFNKKEANSNAKSQQPSRMTPSKSMLSQIQSRIAQSRLKSRLTISRNTPDNLNDERFLYKSMSKKDQKKIEPIANTYSLPVPKIKLLVLNKTKKQTNVKTSEFLDSENTTFDDFKDYRVFNGPQIEAKRYNNLASPDDTYLKKVQKPRNKAFATSKKMPDKDDNLFFARAQSFALDDSIIKQESFDPEDSFIRVVKSPSFLSDKSSFLSFIPYDDIALTKKVTVKTPKPVLTKNHTISSIPLNKLNIYNEPLIHYNGEETDAEDSCFLYNESVDKDDCLFKQNSFEKDDSFIQVVKSPSFLSGQSSIYSLISIGRLKENSKNKYAISKANSNKFDQIIKKYYGYGNFNKVLV